MSGLGVASLVIGILIIGTRGPPIFAPLRTLSAYRSVVADPVQLRIGGFGLAALGLATLVAVRDSAGLAAQILGALGVLMTAASSLILFLPAVFRRIALAAFETLADAVDPPILRALGVLAVAVGPSWSTWESGCSGRSRPPREGATHRGGARAATQPR